MIKRMVILLISMFVLLPAGQSLAQVDTTRYSMSLTDDWTIDGDLPVNAMLISLQGVANLSAPHLYFLYPPKWDFKFSKPLLHYYTQTRGMEFVLLESAEQALDSLAQYAKGYIVWDKSERTSLIVAFTAAGLYESIVVSEELIPMVEQHGLEMKEDFRGQFTGQSDYDIYKWAYDAYWNQCSRDYLVYMGGESGKRMKPGIADFGIMKKAFFTDASTNPKDTQEYGFAKRLFREMNPLSLVMGWHSYGKDSEAQHVTLASNYALRVEGLHSLPNMSFNHQIPLTPGYQFKNNHNVHPDSTYTPEETVYVACIQTDCLGLGAWTEPGRGDIPYAWEVTMNWSWLAPAMLQFFYDEATPNDFFIGSLSGPGYMYPKAIPPEYLPDVIQMADSLMETLDLNVFETMDHTTYWQSDGINDDLTKEVVDAYYENMPDAIGFANGYRPAHTFAVKDGRPFISYDYYLSETRDEAEAAADLEELTNLNPKRPYFLLMHVREWSDIERVKRILGHIEVPHELLPLDIFLKMAGNDFTFKTRHDE